MRMNVAEEYKQEIQEIIDLQVDENREAIFFIYEDGSTSDIYKGQATHIELTRDEESRIMSQGEIIGSVHSHPSGFDLSTIDLMTGIATTQKYMSVATPIYQNDVSENFVVTTIDLSQLGFTERRRMLRAMRRSSAGLTEIGRNIRKEMNLQRFNVEGYRTHEVQIDGIELPLYDRPSLFDIQVGDATRVNSIEGEYKFMEK